MASEFEALQADVVAATEEIRNDTANAPFRFLKDFYAGLDTFLLQVLDSLEELCEEDEYRPSDKSEDIKDGTFKELQRVRQIRTRLHSPDVQENLYFLLEDIKTDLKIQLDIGLEPGQKFLIGDLLNRFGILRRIVFWRIWSEEETNLKIIRLPRTELHRPLSYSLMIHECFHVKDDLISSVENKIGDLDVDIDENRKEEVCVDLLSLNYMGPVYGRRVAEIPDKIGQHEATVHPKPETRLQYTLQYIEWLMDRQSGGVSDRGSSIQQELGDTQDYHPVFISLQNDMKSKLTEREVASVKLFSKNEFNELQECITGLLDEEGIPTYAGERYQLREYLGMPKAEPSLVTDKLEKFLFDAEKNQETALPVKPILLLNLILQVDDYEAKDLETVILLSFKKWFVADRTRDALKEKV